MKKIILLLFLAVTVTTPGFSTKRALPMQVHDGGPQSENIKEDRSPTHLPIDVYYDDDTNVLEVWCDNDNIQGEVYVYDESGTEEAYLPYMNVALTLTSSGSHSILIVGDGWEGEAFIDSSK